MMRHNLSVSTSISTADEERRQPGADAAWDSGWQESFSFEASAPGGRSVIVRWTLNRDTCWYWAYVMEPTGAVVAVRDHALVLPRGRTLEVRGDGLWADGVCEVPLEHWSLSLEAFAVRLDEALDGWRDERGELGAFGFELDWEATSNAQRAAGGYVQPGRLTGDFVLGRETSRVDLAALRSHRVRESRPASPSAELRVLDAAQTRVIGSISGGDAAGDDVRVQRTSSGLVHEAVAGSGTFTADQVIAVPTPDLRTCIASGLFATAAGAELRAWLEAIG